MTFVHKGNIMKFTEGAFKDWGYELAVEEFGATPLDGGLGTNWSIPHGQDDRDQGHDRGRHVAADTDPSR